MGTIIPSVSFGVNLPGQSLFSQIGSQLSAGSLSEVNPIDSLGNITAPLDNIWKSVNSQLSGFINNKSNSINLPRPLKLSLGSGLTSGNTSSILEIAKSAFVLVGNILVAVLEIALGILKAVLSLMR